MREPQSEVDNVYFIVEATAATVGTERAEDVVSDEDLVETRACHQLAVSVGGCHPDAALGG